MNFRCSLSHDVSQYFTTVSIEEEKKQYDSTKKKISLKKSKGQHGDKYYIIIRGQVCVLLPASDSNDSPADSYLSHTLLSAKEKKKLH